MIYLVHADAVLTFGTFGIVEGIKDLRHYEKGTIWPPFVRIDGVALRSMPWPDRYRLNWECDDNTRDEEALVRWIIGNFQLPGPRNRWPPLQGASRKRYDWSGALIIDHPIMPL